MDGSNREGTGSPADIVRPENAAGKRRVAITGSHGLIGSALVRLLTGDGIEVVRVVRRNPAAGDVLWDPARGEIDRHRLESLDAVVHLAGENLAAGRWTAARKRRLAASRIAGTTLLSRALTQLEAPPAVLISASAIGFYGDRGDEILTEASAPGSGFLAELAQAWEAAAEPARAAGIRVVHPRFGVVLSPAGGALARLLPIFRLGLGGRLGSGRQWMSVQTLDDTVTAIRHTMTHAELSGAVNVTSPAPLTNAQFARALGRALHRPALLPVPAPILKLLLGQLADETLLASQRVLPERLLQTGYRFQDPTADSALARLLDR